jgi:hypothetical protein
MAGGVPALASTGSGGAHAQAAPLVEWASVVVKEFSEVKSWASATRQGAGAPGAEQEPRSAAP